MKTVVSGVALAAMLALAMPAWAQGTDAQQSNANPPATGVSTSHAKKAHATGGMHTRKTSHKNVHRAAMRHHGGHHYAANTRSMHRTTARAGGAGPSDNMANQLNRQENQRLSGSSSPPMNGQNMAPPAGNPNMGGTGNSNMAPTGAPNQPRPMQGQ